MPRTRFLLPDAEVASYEWGSYCISLAPSVGLERDTVPRIMDGLSNRIAFWSDASEFRRGIAILHESVHCLQDVTTGVGLWDFFLGLDRTPALLDELRRGSHSTPFGQAMPTPERAAYDQWLDDGFVPQSDAAALRRHAHLEARAAIAPHIQVNDLDVLSIDRLLEAEAVIQVHLVLETLEMGAGRARTMAEHRPLWSAPDMADLYQGVYHDVIAVVRRWADAEGVALDRPAILTALLLAAMLLEISLAHPGAEFIARSGLDPRDHDPGLKFVLLLSALASLSLAEHGALMTAVTGGNVEEAERLLLARCPIPYAHSRAIYEDWIRCLEQRQGGDPRIDLRLLALRKRLERPAGVLFKSIARFFDFGLPVIVVSDGDFRLTSMNPDYVVGTTRFELIRVIAREQAIKRFFCSAFEGTPFVCTHAELGTCPASTAICREGITRARDFPADERCAIRRMASGGAFGTFRNLFKD